MSKIKSISWIWVGIICGVIAVAITSCGGASEVPDSKSQSSASPTSTTNDDPNDKSVYHVKRDADVKYQQNPGLPGWNEAARLTIEEKLGWNNLPDGAKSTALPSDMAGVDFLGDDGTEIRCLAASKATILTPQDQALIDASYKVDQNGIDLRYMENGKECHSVYGAQSSGRKVMLNLQSATLPKFPSVLRGTLP
ncbi:MAG: hypothetical protein K2Z81_12570 [Cyanobacteria bacterium]|nr:hypothetical protein [Cyanobacteriota bacterium]